MHGHYEAAGWASMAVILQIVGRAAGLQIGGTELKERGIRTQQVLENNIEHISSGQNDTANGIMGYGGALTLVNGSPFEWTLSGQSSYQMDAWKWPNVAAGTIKITVCAHMILTPDR